MADLFIGPVIETLTTELVSLIPKLRGLGKAGQEMQECCHLLAEITTVLKDHEEMKYKNYRLISWHQDLNTLLEDLRDVADALKDDSQLGILHRIKKVMNPHSTVDDELKAITRKIRFLYQRKEMLDRAKESDGERPRTITGPVSAESKLFGRETEKEKIIDLLNIPSSYGEYGYDFISIVGMGGIGKTTLAQHVYNDDNVASFPIRAWFSVSMDFKPCKIYRSIIEQLTGQCHINDSSAMQEMLRSLLMGKKFLIVFDDYWSESMHEFDTLRSPFISAKSGSKFIITTRNRAVAKRFTAEERIIDLGLMSNEDCWSLFCSGSRLKIDSTSNLAAIGKEICEKCDGLPLSVAVIRGMLSVIDEEAGWRDVLNDNKLANGEIFDVHSIMRTSYVNLSDQLKTCFSFCTIFPKGHIFDKKWTVDLWMSAGIIQCDNQLKGESLGDRSFDDLVSRGLLALNPNGYVMHDIIRATGKQVSGEIYCNWEEEVGSWEKIRHVRISKQMTTNALENLKLFPREMVQLRTLIVDGENYNNTDDMGILFLKVKHLRVLIMQNFKVPKISKYLAQMTYLRKLEIQSFNELKKMPLITKLKNLIELDIKGCNSLTGPLPLDLWRLRGLRKLSIEDCNSLKGSIPQKLGELKSLTSFEIKGCSSLTGPIPSKLGGLKGLTKLVIVSCKGLTGPIFLELVGLTMLKEIIVWECEGLTGPIPQEFECLTKLTTLIIGGCEKLKGPISPKLGGLTILKELSVWSCEGLTGPIPPELGFLTALTKLEIGYCEGLTGPIPPELGALAMLRELVVLGCKSLKGSIPSELGKLTRLTSLKISMCRGLTGAIPLELVGLTKLRELIVTECEGLTGSIPLKLGGLTELMTLHLGCCKSLTGSIPLELGALINLRDLAVWECEGLTGSIPPELGDLLRLETFYLSNCGGLTGAIPPELRGLTRLTSLHISRCKGLTGPIPPELGSLTRLTTLQIGCESLIGPIPPELGHLAMLRELSICGCECLTGTIPPELGGLTKLTRLNISDCRSLTGLIPPELGNLVRLEAFEISKCDGLIGPIPLELVGLKRLQIFYISDCGGLIGQIPPELRGLTGLT